MRVQPLRAVPVKTTARAYSIQARALYEALRANELRSYCVRGKRAVLIFSEVEDWLRQHPAKLPNVRTTP